MMTEDKLITEPQNYIHGKTGPWEMVIGIEVHAQISSQAKLFSGASTEFGATPNAQVSFIDAGFPGMLPVVNQECVRQAIRSGLSFGSMINRRSVFARKNYFYPDLPQGYQISQFEEPIVSGGSIEIDLEDGSQKIIRIERLHIEQDAGKSLHDQHPSLSFIDLNRSGVALMEIVSRPDIRSAEQAAAYVGKLRNLLRYIGACDGNMAEGSLRADVNLSLHRPGTPFGTRAEIKNVNSLRFIRQAVEVEAARQLAILEDGGTIIQETRLFDPGQGATRSMRSKEDAHDYRYFPDPDLLPLRLSEEEIAEAKASLPELPDDLRQRLMKEDGLGRFEASLIVTEIETSRYYQQARQGGVNPKTLANWLVGELFGRLAKLNQDLTDCRVPPQHLAELVKLIDGGSLSGKMGKDILDEMVETGERAASIVERKGLKQINDEGELEAVIDQLLADNEGQVEQFRQGKTGLMGWFVGQVMKLTKGQANPAAVNKLLASKLGN